MLDEAGGVGGAKERQIDSLAPEAMIQEPAGEAHCVGDGARAQTSLLDEISFKVHQQCRSHDLRFGQGHGLHHADIDQMFSEPPGKMMEADLGVRSTLWRPRQLVREIGSQCQRLDSFGIHQSPQLPGKMAIGSDRPRFVVGGGKALRERV